MFQEAVLGSGSEDSVDLSGEIFYQEPAFNFTLSPSDPLSAVSSVSDDGAANDVTGGAVVSEPSTSSVASAGWFIALMVAIIFLILILLIICLIRRNRGGKYPVHEKEKLRGRHPDDNEEGFGEYTRAPLMEYKPSEPDYKKSQGSINSDQKPLESDTDSMAEYDDPDHGKFNEDGSFIGQYGGKKRGETKLDDSTAPSALSTFV